MEHYWDRCISVAVNASWLVRCTPCKFSICIYVIFQTEHKAADAISCGSSFRRTAYTQASAIFAKIYVFSPLPDVQNVFISASKRKCCLFASNLSQVKIIRSIELLSWLGRKSTFVFFPSPICNSLQSSSTVMYIAATPTPTHRNDYLYVTFFFFTLLDVREFSDGSML